MKKGMYLLYAILWLFGAGVAHAHDVYVHGYYRSNGTHVHSYHRSAPDHSYNNNWSVSPNVNPYTGKEGTRSPTFNDRPPPTNNFGGSSAPNMYSQPSNNNNGAYGSGGLGNSGY